MNERRKYAWIKCNRKVEKEHDKLKERERTVTEWLKERMRKQKQKKAVERKKEERNCKRKEVSLILTNWMKYIISDSQVRLRPSTGNM